MVYYFGRAMACCTFYGVSVGCVRDGTTDIDYVCEIEERGLKTVGDVFYVFYCVAV